MRIIDLQRRLREIGRIRIGEKVATSTGKMRPAKIDTFRFTSQDQQVIEAAAGLWGGTVEPWPEGPGGGQWQVRTTARQIAVVVPPGDMAFSQAYEQWTAGGCKVRCDGRWDHLCDKACHCDPENRACAIHTRLSLIVPDLPGVGLWRLETHGYYAAVELGGSVDICATQSARGVMLPARLRLEHREVKRTVDGQVQTFKFVVPALDLDVHPLALAGPATTVGGLGPAAAGQIGPPPAGELEAPALLTPVPEPDGSLAPTVAEQLAAVDVPSRPRERSNAAQPIPATGLRPRPAADVPEPDEIQAGGPADRGIGSSDVAQQAEKAFASFKEAAPRGKKVAAVERLRRAVTWIVTECRSASLKECSAEELAAIYRRLEAIERGTVTVEADPLADDAGATFRWDGGERSVTWSEWESTQEGTGDER